MATAAGVVAIVDATLVGVDTDRDIALLQLAPVPGGGGLRALALASAPPRVGDAAVALGAPYGYDRSVTAGVVSALDRTVANPARGVATQTGGLPRADLQGALQHSAPTYPGSSGGPVLNAAGAVVGMTVATFVDGGGGGVARAAFAVSSSTLRRVLPAMAATGAAPPPAAGLTLLPPATAASFGGQVVVAAVAPGSPAAAAGILPTRRGAGGVIAGDAILRVGGVPVASAGELEAALDAAAGGAAVRVVLRREGREVGVDVVVP